MVSEMYLGTCQTSFQFYVQQFIEVQKYSGIWNAELNCLDFSHLEKWNVLSTCK